MNRPTIYLAGPISGGTYEGVTDWRNYAHRWLQEHNIDALSPMRGKQHLLKVLTIKDTHDEHVLSTARAIMHRDYFDVARSDALLVNFLDSERVSIGTCMEIAWAYAAHKPVICIQDEHGSMHQHAMLKEATSYRVTTLQQGLELARVVLNPEI